MPVGVYFEIICACTVVSLFRVLIGHRWPCLSPNHEIVENLKHQSLLIPADFHRAMSVEEGEAVAAATVVAADEESGTKRKADTFDEGEDEPAFTPSKGMLSSSL